MNKFVKLSDKLSDVMAKISAVILGLMSILILVEIFIWNLFEKTTLIADEYSAYGLAAIIFMGAGYCLKEKKPYQNYPGSGILTPKGGKGHHFFCNFDYHFVYGIFMVVSF